MQLTPEQAQAITNHSQNLIVIAGAGSGKTSVLVQRFMALLEAHPDWSLLNIVAITFTEKAAREMRERIRSAVQAKVAHAKTDDERQMWREHANNLDSARISTIHGLCSRILRANPVEAGLDPRFETLDEVNATTLQNDVIERTLGLMVEEGQPSARLLPKFEGSRVRRVLANFIAQGWIDDELNNMGKLTPEQLWEEWEFRLNSANRTTLDSIRNDHHLRGILDNLPTDFPRGDKIGEQVEGALKFRDRQLDGNNEALIEGLTRLSEINLTGGKSTLWGDKETFQAVKEDLKLIREIARAALGALYPPLGNVDKEALEWILLWRDALQRVRYEYQLAKIERQALDFDDLEGMTLRLLENHPEVARRYYDPGDGEFKHVMVDEFQDTNNEQRRIVYALCGIDIARNVAPAGRLFVVGDPKQSIYQFRGADVSVFQDVQRQIIAANGREVNLNVSFRTHTRLVNRFNDFFSQLLRKDPSPAIEFSVDFGADMHAHRESPPHQHPPVQMIILKKDKDNSAHKGLDTEDMRRWEAYEIARQVQAMVANATPIWDKRQGAYRPMEFGDVAVLFRAMSSVALYEEIFQAMGVPYLTVAGKGYFNQQEIWDLMNLLKALHNPADDLALASVLRSPLFNFNDDTLLALRWRSIEGKYPLPLWQALFWQGEPLPHWVPLPDLPEITFARETLRVLYGLAGRVTIGELLSQALDMTGFEAALISLPNGQRKRANVLKFLEVARNSQRVSLSEFNAYIAEMVNAEAREGEATLEPQGTVTLMTVHRSKGLEYPVVVLADSSYRGNTRTDTVMLTRQLGLACKITDDEEEGRAKDKPKPFIYNLSIDFERAREFAEQKRLLYVGATRAQDYLIISGQQRKDNSWLGQLSHLLDITDGGDGFSHPDITLTYPTELPPASILRKTQPRKTLWETLTPKPTTAMNLPLLTKLPPRVPPIRHISASHLEVLGRVHDGYSRTSATDFRRQVLRGAPPAIRPLASVSPTTVPAFVIGNMVHRALKVQLVEADLNLDAQAEILQGYAWEEGVTHPDAVLNAVDQALTLLEQYRQSDLYAMMQTAQQRYREIEFVLRQGDYVIHGIIDTLFQKADGQWVVLDYKTDNVNRRTISEESRQYHYQLGAYALAVTEMFGHMPQVLLYYLRPNQVWEITAQEWSSAIGGLELELNTILAEG